MEQVMVLFCDGSAGVDWNKMTWGSCTSTSPPRCFPDTLNQRWGGLRKGHKWLSAGSMGLNWECKNNNPSLGYGRMLIAMTCGMIHAFVFHLVAMHCVFPVNVYVAKLLSFWFQHLSKKALYIVFYVLSWLAEILLWGQKLQGICCTMGGKLQCNLFLYRG